MSKKKKAGPWKYCLTLNRSVAQRGLGTTALTQSPSATHSSCQAWPSGPGAAGHRRRRPGPLPWSLGMTSPPSWLRHRGQLPVSFTKTISTAPFPNGFSCSQWTDHESERDSGHIIIHVCIYACSSLHKASLKNYNNWLRLRKLSLLTGWIVTVVTCESPYRPGIYNYVREFEAQLMNCKLDHYVHGIGLILGERHSLKDRGQRKRDTVKVFKPLHDLKSTDQTTQKAWISFVM